MSFAVKALAAAGLLAVASSAHAAQVILNFDGITTTQFTNPAVLDFYAGGHSSDGSGPGPNFGITFSDAALVSCDAATCNSNIAGLPSAPNGLIFEEDQTAFMNIAGGFNQALTFSWVSLDNTQITFWSGLNGTGEMLNTVALPRQESGSNLPGCEHAFCPFQTSTIQALGDVHSVEFEHVTHAVFDDITVSGVTLPDAVPEPASWALMITGFGLCGAALRRRRASALAA
jgi:hypothetical protein